MTKYVNNLVCGGLASLMVLACGDDVVQPQEAMAGSGSEMTAQSEMVEATDKPDEVAVADFATAPGCAAIDLEAPTDGLQFSMPVHVPKGSENEFCMLVLVDEAINLNRSDGRFTVGSHHALVERTSYRDAIPTQTVTGMPFADADRPHVCATPGSLWDTLGVIAGGRDVDTVELDGPEEGLPDNVAYKIEAGEVLMLNFHMININDEDQDACYKLNLHGIPDAQTEHEAGTIFFYNPYITVPAAGTASARLACPVDQDVTLLNAVSHMHERGVASQAFLWDGNPHEDTSASLLQFYEDLEWDEPPGSAYEGGMLLKAGQWIDWNCDYENPEDRDVSQGLRSTDEMCMFIGTYYPRNLEFEQCGQYGFTRAATWGSGTMNGAEFLDCASATGFDLFPDEASPGRYAAQKCFTDTCPAASAKIGQFFGCIAENLNLAGCEDLQQRSLRPRAIERSGGKPPG